MTALKLFLLILLAVLVQLGIFAAIAFYRHWVSFEKLKSQLSGLVSGDVPVHQLVQESVSETVLPSPLPSLWQGTRKFIVQRKFFEDKNRSVCSFYLVPEDGELLPAFKPGQYLTFQFNIMDPVSQTPHKVIRCYTLSEQPRPDYYRITVKKMQPPADQPDVPAGVSSSYLHEQVQEGDILDIRAPGGQFYLDDEIKEPIVLISGGIGITPMLSMMHAALQADPQREIWFFYGVRDSHEHIMKDHIWELAAKFKKLHLHVCYSRAGENDIEGVDYQHATRVDIDLLRLTLPLKSFQFYICGPKPMMETIVPALEHWGVPDHQIHYESFGPASISRHEQVVKEKPLVDVEPVMVTFSKSGKSLQWDSSCSCLLEFAEDNGIVLDFGCRAGSCGTCQTLIESGEVEYNQEPDVDLEVGSCLLCIAIPKTDLTLLA